MDIEPEAAWSQQKLYLFGQLGFLPDTLENKPLRAKKLRHYFDEDRLEAELREFERGGYFAVKATGVGEFTLTSIDSKRFHKELAAYLKDIEPTLAAQQSVLWDIAAKQYKERHYRPVIRWRQIYGDTSRYNYSPPFWELIFIPALSGRIKLITLGHDKTVPMAKELLQFYERPYAEVEILERALQRRVAKPRGTVKHKATLQLTAKKLWLILDGQHYPFCSYKNTGSNTYRVASALDGAIKPLARSELNLKPNTTTDLSTLLGNAGFKDIMRDLFITTAYDKQHKRDVVKLKKSVDLDEEQYTQLLEYVNSLKATTP